MGAQLAALTERLAAAGIASPTAAVAQEGEAGQVCKLHGCGGIAAPSSHCPGLRCKGHLAMQALQVLYDPARLAPTHHPCSGPNMPGICFSMVQIRES